MLYSHALKVFIQVPITNYHAMLFVIFKRKIDLHHNTKKCLHIPITSGQVTTVAETQQVVECS
jgi:hypothetical protein